MDAKCVRLLSVELKQFKNTEYGKVEMPQAGETNLNDLQADILGIYGQNGSGKTSVIEALDFLKILITGESLPADIEHFIGLGHQYFALSFRFMICLDTHNLLVTYDFSIAKTATGEINVSNEKIAYSKIENGIKQPEKTLIKFNRESTSEEFSPKHRYHEIADSQDERIKIAVAKVVSGKDKKSFIFCDEFHKLWSSGIKHDEAWKILTILYEYAIANIFVIGNSHAGIISTNRGLPFAFRHTNNEQHYSVGTMLIVLSKPTVFEKNQYQLFEEMVSKIDFVIGSIIPNLSISARNLGEQMTPDGKDGVRFELVSKRGDSVIPLLYESEGIKKIVSILNLLVTVYNNPSVCVAIDELDSGIYEYLLGEILSVIAETGKGQLIFTSHNLRPLELINKSSIVFTTTNPRNRYIHMSNVKNNNNLRDMYLRSINLGGQKESVYEPTNNYEIRRAMRKAGAKHNG